MFEGSNPTHLSPGAHVSCTRRFGMLPYQHHGVLTDNDRVIHYEFVDRDRPRAVVVETSLGVFLRGSRLKIVAASSPHFSETEIIKRARSRLGESRYSLIWNNCEHFVNWCRTGNAASEQVKRCVVAVTAVVMLTVASVMNSRVDTAVLSKRAAA